MADDSEEQQESIPFVTVDPVPEGTTLLETTEGLRVPPTFLATYHDPTRPYDVHIMIGTGYDRVPAVRQIHMVIRGEEFGRHPPSTLELRLPLASILEAAVGIAAKQGGTQPVSGQPSRRTRRRLTPQRLEEVAEVVRDAAARGEPIRRAVAQAFGPMSEYTARNWIAAARAEGGPLHKKKEA